MAEIKKRKTRMYEPWGYQEENNYQGGETILYNDLESFFAGTSYNKDDNKIYFTNKDGELKASLDVSEFVKSDTIIDKTEYKDGILKIYFTNGDVITIDLSELLDENEFKDGLIVDNHEIKVLIDSTGEPYLSVSEDGVKISGVDAAIQVETDRATAAEEVLDEKIEDEIARATSAETAFDEKIEAETTRATEAETALQDAIDAEATRAQEAEADLQAAIDQEIADRTADVDEEETRAKAAEQALQTALTNEITRATQTEQQLNHRIDMVNDELDSEESRAQAAEQELRTLLTNEIAERKADVDEEEARAKAAEQALQDAIDDEEARATSAETALQNAIDAEAARATSAETALQNAIDAEAARATSAETALQDAIDDEEARATSAETALQNAIDAEATRAQEAEADLQAAIDQEIADRIADVDAEETRAKGVEADLQNQLNNLGNNKFDDAVYDSSAKTINFYAEGAVVATIDATDFIKDGMIDRVYIDNETQELVIVWNAASGKDETRIPLSDIFNPENYYTKDEIDDKVDTINSAITVVEGDIVNINSAITEIQGDITTIEGDITNINSAITNINEAIDEMEDQYGDEISALTDSVRELEETVENDEFAVAMALNDLNTRKLDASAYTPTDLSNYYTKDETSGKTEIADALDNFYTKEEIDAADYVVSESLNNLNTRINAHTADTDVHVTTAEKTAWNEKADLSDIPSVAPYADSVKYNSTTHFVEFYHGTTAGTKVFEYDASPFLIDGMVESVEVVTVDDVKYLRITWNSAAGGQVTDIPLGDLFDPSLYYTKDEIDAAEYTISKALVDLDERKLDASAYTPTDLSNYYTKSETSGATEISTALADKADTATTYTKTEVDARDLWVSGTGTNSVVLKGASNTANGIDACAEGGGNKADGGYSHAEGYATVAKGLMAHTEGYYSSGTSDASHAEGNRTLATAQFSHAEGNQSIASGSDSHAEGTSSSATTNSAHAEGFHTLASGGYSHAEGYATVASGNFTHVEGNATSATTSYAHAEGEATAAKGPHSHAEGYNTITNNDGEHASGKFNVSTTGLTSAVKTLFSIGNGTANDARHNAFEVRENGDIYITINGNDVLLQDYITELERITAKALTDLDSRLRALEG